MARPLPLIDELRATFYVDGCTLRWKIKRWRANAGDAAGRVSSDGRVNVKLHQKMFKAHRIVYAMVHGIDPGDLQVDHIDGNPSNNAPENLRLATPSQNGMNRALGAKANNSSGFRNVTWDEHTRSWLVHVKAQGNVHHIGRFKEKRDAIEAAERARLSLHGEFANTERSHALH